MSEADLREHILRLRAAFLVLLARRLKLEVGEDRVRELVRSHNDAEVFAAIESDYRWKWRRIYRSIRGWFSIE